MIYERTGKCPYTERCGHYQSMLQIEEHLLKDRRDAAVNRNSLERDDYERIMEGHQKKLEDLSRAMTKCHEHKGRCLRFWQFVHDHAPEEATSSHVIPRVQP